MRSFRVLTVSRGKDKGKLTAKVCDAPREKLLRLGRERALIYKTLLLTGLRVNELRSITIAQVVLDGPTPMLVLHAADEKNRQGSNIPLRADLAEEIRDWLAEKQAVLARSLEMDEKLFHVSQSILKAFDKDLEHAGIGKRDERGRTVDLHALRHTFGTHLAMAGVAPRTAMAAMRHSSLELTMNVYTDPALLDVAGAINALPTF
ncbi:MAG: site-specific integrase [Phycisphaerae bacterium]|nr:site-specific integrase [Phycisphaerae bacterium]